MVEVTFYNNGYEIHGHARQDVCSEVSVFMWAVSNIIINIDKEAKHHFPPEQTTSNEGYLIYNGENEFSEKTGYMIKEMLRIWAEKYRWQEDGHVRIINKDEKLVIG